MTAPDAPRIESPAALRLQLYRAHQIARTAALVRSLVALPLQLGALALMLRDAPAAGAWCLAAGVSLTLLCDRMSSRQLPAIAALTRRLWTGHKT